MASVLILRSFDQRVKAQRGSLYVVPWEKGGHKKELEAAYNDDVV